MGRREGSNATRRLLVKFANKGDGELLLPPVVAPILRSHGGAVANCVYFGLIVCCFVCFLGGERGRTVNVINLFVYLVIFLMSVASNQEQPPQSSRLFQVSLTNVYRLYLQLPFAICPPLCSVIQHPSKWADSQR